jgi:hypothetical protein
MKQIIYKSPSKKVFNEIKRICKIQWRTYSNEFGYVNEKIKRIEQIKNFQADVIFMLNMFHPVLKHVLISKLSLEAKKYIKYYDELNN